MDSDDKLHTKRMDYDHATYDLPIDNKPQDYKIDVVVTLPSAVMSENRVPNWPPGEIRPCEVEK